MRLRCVTIAYLLFCVLFLPGCRHAKPSFERPVVIYTPSIAGHSSSSGHPSSAPSSVLVQVPFASQSPFAHWDALHEEACEEMSLVMVHHFLEATPLSLDDAEREVQEVIAWERAHGYADDVTVGQLGEVARALYRSHVRVLTDVTVQSLRHELAQGHPVIIPAAGRLLHNPFFSGAGPFYHMLVVVGYTDRGFITNDPGTKRGEQYWYRTDVLLGAIHDWVGVKENIAQGPKRALVLER